MRKGFLLYYCASLKLYVGVIVLIVQRKSFNLNVLYHCSLVILLVSTFLAPSIQKFDKNN